MDRSLTFHHELLTRHIAKGETSYISEILVLVLPPPSRLAYRATILLYHPQLSSNNLASMPSVLTEGELRTQNSLSEKTTLTKPQKR